MKQEGDMVDFDFGSLVIVFEGLNTRVRRHKKFKRFRAKADDLVEWHTCEHPEVE